MKGKQHITAVIIMSAITGCVLTASAQDSLRHAKVTTQLTWQDMKAAQPVQHQFIMPRKQLHSTPSLIKVPVVDNRTPSFFCRIETQIEHKSGIPLRFRLGSLAYSDWLEGKTSVIERDR